MILNYILDNNILFYSAFAGVSGLITWNFVRGVLLNSQTNVTDLNLDISSTDSGVDTIKALSNDSLLTTPTSIFERTYSEIGVQASEVLNINTQNLNEFAVLSAEISNKSTQTLINKLDQGIQTMDILETKVPVDLINLFDSPIKTFAYTEAFNKSEIITNYADRASLLGDAVGLWTMF